MGVAEFSSARRPAAGSFGNPIDAVAWVLSQGGDDRGWRLRSGLVACGDSRRAAWEWVYPQTCANPLLHQ